MLRKIRRGGPTGEGIAGLIGLSHPDDEVRINDGGGACAVDHDVGDRRRDRAADGRAAVMRTAPPALSDAFFSATTAPPGDATFAGVLTDAFFDRADDLLELIPAPGGGLRPGALRT